LVLIEARRRTAEGFVEATFHIPEDIMRALKMKAVQENKRFTIMQTQQLEYITCRFFLYAKFIISLSHSFICKHTDIGMWPDNVTHCSVTYSVVNLDTSK
jgi:hypothetical protein